ncbi:MAG: hypothetical protein KKA60_03905 [Proteobacteria bacterium]|nr:hypothetical protein [Pseudomonadota bacterium]
MDPTQGASFVRRHATLFMIIGLCLFLVETQIFAVAAMRSGDKSTIRVFSGEQLVYETQGDRLTEVQKKSFEQTFGPLSGYTVRVESRHEPFPFRGWLLAAVGFPLGAVLLFAFFVRALARILEPPPLDTPGEAERDGFVPEHSYDKWSERLARTNVFVLAGAVILLLLLLWLMPNLVMYLGRTGAGMLASSKWYILSLAGVLAALAAWAFYLRFLLAKKSLETRAELERLRITLFRGAEDVTLLPGHTGDEAPFQALQAPTGQPDGST